MKHVYVTPNYLNLYDSGLAESKRLLKSLTQKSRARHSISTSALDYGDKTLLVLAADSGGVSLCSFATVNDTSTGIVSASISLAFLISNEIVKMFLKTMEIKTNYCSICHK